MSSFPKRGRPPTASIEQRIAEGMASDSQLKCFVCQRVFPRPKSLRAHYHCHTGRTPYDCDYPGCDKSFRQSGHLRSHIFRHTGEKPFKCPTEDCAERFIHSNRRCNIHDPLKSIKLIRDGKEFIDVNESNLSEDQRQWITRYRNKKYNPRGTKRPQENDSDEENFPVNNKRNNGYNSAGTSPSSSPTYKIDEYNSTPSQSPEPTYYRLDESVLDERLDESVLEGARCLMQMKNRSF